MLVMNKPRTRRSEQKKAGEKSETAPWATGVVCVCERDRGRMVGITPGLSWNSTILIEPPPNQLPYYQVHREQSE